MSSLAFSDSFEYLCYGSTANRNIFYFYSAGIDFSRQNLTSTDVRFCRLKSIPALEGLTLVLREQFIYGFKQVLDQSKYHLI